MSQKLRRESLKDVAENADKNVDSPSMIGRSLRHYRITASLGRGGMGEVWLARDTSLERDVAIKTLPAADDEDAATRKERFFREARAASALNHPNIITIYEINTDQDIDFIAMEYVDGRTLADVLQRGPLPLDQVRRLAQQIADAVGQAHQAGIVHRDLKPRNIMVTRQGLVKVLDFGLAKLTRAGDAQTSAAATQMNLTRAGTTVGTVGYMSPEQAIGDPVDARTDVFSFGVILYEMLTGRLPFAGETMSEVLRQLHFAEPPAVESLRADTPAALRDIVTRAMRKRPDERFADMGEVGKALTADTVVTAAKTVVMPVARPAPERPAPPPPPVRTGMRFAVTALIVVLLAGVAAVAVRQLRMRRAAPETAATVAKIETQAPQPVQPTPAQPPAKAAEPPATPRPAPEPLTHLHWGRLGDAYRAEPGRQADATTAYRRALALVDEQIARSGGGADLGSWRALYLARLGERANAIATLDPLVKGADLSAETMFRMALTFELAGARPRALMGVARAVREGYPPTAVLAEPDLAGLRSDPRFRRMATSPPARKRPRQ